MMENLDRLLLIPSKSRYELSIEKYGSEETARQHFKSERRWNFVKESYLRQQAAIEGVVELLDRDMVINRDVLDTRINDYDLFVFLGGDNHFTYCSQMVLQYMKENPGTEKYVAGVVLDPVKSFGGLLYFNVDSFLYNFADLCQGKFQIERWATLEAVVNNGVKEVSPYPAVGDIFIGEYCNLLMSRNDVFEQSAYLEGKEILPEKGSGVLVAVGAGSGDGSWYDNIHQCYFDEPDEFNKEAEVARIITRENRDKVKVNLYKGQKLVLDSYNDTAGIISPDSHLEHSVRFDMGAQAKIWISDLKLNVVRI